MDSSGDRWFSEPAIEGFEYRYQVDEVVYKGRSRFQEIGIYDTVSFGRILVLDGCVQTTVKDEYCYHEMLVYPALCSHPDPQRVLLIGGGDGGALRRVLEFPVRQADMVELDEDVVTLCRKYMPEISRGAFEDKRANLMIKDGIEYITGQKNIYDIIIIDSTDPVGPAEMLFSGSFYKDIFEALTEEGIIVTQSGSPFFQADVLEMAVNGLKEHFRIVKPYTSFVTTYPGVFWSYTLGSKKIDPAAVSGGTISDRVNNYSLKTRLFTPEIHAASFVLPAFVKQLIGG